MKNRLMSFGHILVALLVLFAPSTAASQTKAEIADNCVAAVNAGDMSSAMDIALAISEWRHLYISTTRDAAEFCLSKTLSGLWKYSDVEGAFLSGEEAQLAIEADAVEAARLKAIEITQCEINVIRKEIDTLSDNAQINLEARSIELSIAVFGACTRNYLDSPDATVLNPICNDAFKLAGLPDTQFPSNFAEITDARQRLASTQIRLLLLQNSKSLVAEDAQLSEDHRCIDLLASQ